jgi:RimJ/RimL family protein N-acetyltransferase
MSWICRLCETVNTDDVLECEVCDAVSPYLSRFDYDEIDPDTPTTIRWQAEACDCVKLSYRGHITDVTHLNAARILARRDTEVTFILKNDVTEREFTYDVREHKPPITRIRFLQKSDKEFVLKLCSDEEFKKYFTLGKYGDDIESFFDTTLNLFAKGMAFPYVIETIDSDPIGMITCQIEMENGKVTGYITYSVLPEYRNYGLATEALMNLRNETKETGVEILNLIISTSNKASRRVAEKCGFKCKDPQLELADDTGLTMMLTWKYVFAEHISKREVMVKKGLEAFTKEECDKALRLYENALKFKCPRRCLYNDGITYIYIGEVYAYQRKFGKALESYKKAKSLGIDNPKVDKEIKWLESNLYSL